MSEADGMFKEQNLQDGARPVTSRVVSASMMRSVMSPSDNSSSSSDTTPWSSAIGHAGTGKSGRVIERLQGDIDKLRREKQVLKMRHEEAEKAKEALAARNQSLQDRNSIYEQSHEAHDRQLKRRERQVKELQDELAKERAKTAHAQSQAAAAAESEESWRIEASQAKALAAQREAEYETIIACRKMDYDRHQGGLDKIRAQFNDLLRRTEDDAGKQKKLEIVAEQQRQTISALEDLTRRLTANFKTYREQIDTAITELKAKAGSNDDAITQKLDEMTEVTGRMRWVMKVEGVMNHGQSESASQQGHQLNGHSDFSDQRSENSGRRSPTKLIKHRRKESTKVSR
ncbi:hypothetical protein PV08_00543 [Exophiala spinifera]|uniref:SWI5-dependent HO expression protein 3 n=1 Tax=Exophiala spinifera TaxID=91928 RepID=A0A0D2BM21_9EURO|nr:uncharacterized protein PV08_00543 [Exophiala spinifera]KIW19968.1 hypothetical protein PV08_00543 [Exophiala spinifera]